MGEEKKFPICDALSENAAKHCAALVVTQNVLTNDKGWPHFAEPSDELRNGTLTFVETEGRVFGITCWHVVDHFRKQLSQSGNPHSHTMRTMVNGFYVVGDRFIRPEQQFGDPPIDIAVRELDPEFVATIGKTPLSLDLPTHAPDDIEHGYAVGFPETMKYKKMEDHTGYRISMPQVEILAELQGVPTRRFTLFSELNGKPQQTDYSGMSGGPIFWSTEDNYGILGILYEGGTSADERSVYVYGEVATPEVIKSWLREVRPN